MNQTTPTNHLGPDQLNVFVDGELSPAEQHGVEQHLTTCHACTLRVLSATQLKAATPRAGPRFPPPPPFPPPNPATPQVISPDRPTVKPLFQGRLPFSFNLPDATALPPDT